MMLDLTKEETAFLQSVLGQVVPNMSVPAKDAAGILNMCQGILDKLQSKSEGE